MMIAEQCFICHEPFSLPAKDFTLVITLYGQYATAPCPVCGFPTERDLDAATARRIFLSDAKLASE